MSSALIPSKIFGEGLRRKWPSGMTLHLPLTSDLNPVVGTGGAMTITRASVKRQQNTANSFAVHGNNVLLSTQNVFGIAANGLHVEQAVTNDVTNSDDMTIAGAWEAINCTVSSKDVTDPAGVVNQAQTLTPTSNGGYIQNTTAVACSSKNVLGTCWLRRKAGAAGSHTGQLILTDSAGTVTASKDITVTSAWQCFYHEYTGTGAGAETAILRIVPDKTGTTPVDARLPFVEVFADTNIKTLMTPALATRAADVASQNISGTVNGSVGTLYGEAVPLRTFTDGQLEYYLTLDKLNAAGTFWVGLLRTSTVMRAIYFNGANQFTSNLDVSAFARATKFKFAIGYSTGGVNFYVNGSLAGEKVASITMGDAVLPTTSRLRIGFKDSGTQQPNAVVSNIRYWPFRLTDAQMARITA